MIAVVFKLLLCGITVLTLVHPRRANGSVHGRQLVLTLRHPVG